MKLMKDDDGMVDVVNKLFFPTATLLFLIFSYFHSVKPVFDKYQELQDTKKQVQDLSLERERLNKTVQETGTQLDTLNNQFTSMKKQSESLTQEVTARRDELNSLQRQLQTAAYGAVEAHIYRLLDNVVQWNIRNRFSASPSKEKMDLQAYCLQLANSNIKRLEQVKENDPKYYELRANLLFRDFAEKELKPGITEVDPVFNIFYFLAKQRE